jgi:hypothetical protein
VKSSRLPNNKWVIVKWENSDQRSWYGCPTGKVVDYDKATKLYAVEHYDFEIPYCLYYARSELAATLWEKLNLRMREIRGRK